MNPDSRPSQIRRADFPALREFFRGYLHQDMNEEYASVAGAAKHFWNDADAEQREAVRQEWNRLLAHFQNRSRAELSRSLTRELGSAQELAPADIEKISALFNS